MEEIKKRYQKFLQRQKIQTSLIVYFVVLLVTSSALFFFLTFRYTEKNMVRQSKEYTGQLIYQVNKEMDAYMELMEDISTMVFDSREIQIFLFGLEENKEEKERVVSKFQTILDTRKDIRNIAVIGDNGRSVVNKGRTLLNPHMSVSKQAWYIRAKEEEGGVVLSRPYIQNTMYSKYDWVISLSRGVVNRSTKRVEGVFLIDLNYTTISRLCGSVSLGEKGYIFVVDKEGNIIYHPKQQLLHSGLKKEEVEIAKYSARKKQGSFLRGQGGQKKLYTLSTSEKTGWTVVGVAYLSEFQKEGTRLQRAYMSLALLLLLAGIVFSVFLSKTITRPIVGLVQGMKEVEKGRFKEAVVKIEGQEEIQRLGESFNMMAEEIQNLMEENTKEQKKKRKAEMKALQSQINPHFLYNTLDSIIWMAESGKHNEEVVEMTAALSRLFRQSIGNEEEMVTIQKELDYIQTYLTIQSLRYRDKLSYEFQIEPEIQAEKIVKLTLQPLVENSIYHGIKYIPGIGKILIRGYREGEDIVLEVEDNGAGMSKETQQSLFVSKEGGIQKGGLGVNNVQNRLRLYYGESYGLSYESEVGRGTKVRIRIPGEWKEREGGE